MHHKLPKYCIFHEPTDRHKWFNDFQNECVFVMVNAVVCQRRGRGLILARGMGPSCWMGYSAQEMSSLWRSVLMHPGASTTVTTWRTLECHVTPIQVNRSTTIQKKQQQQKKSNGSVYINHPKGLWSLYYFVFFC